MPQPKGLTVGTIYIQNRLAWEVVRVIVDGEYETRLVGPALDECTWEELEGVDYEIVQVVDPANYQYEGFYARVNGNYELQTFKAEALE